jgi:hypothetical protein
MNATFYEQCKTQLNKLFDITYNESEPPLSVELVEISPIKSVGDEYKSFSLLFQAPKDKCLLGQGTWTLTNEQQESVNIFLVPVAEVENNYQYESVFSFRE